MDIELDICHVPLSSGERKFKALIRHARTVDRAAKRRKFEAEVESYRYFTELPFWKRPEKEPKLLIQNGEAYPVESAY